VAAQFGFTANLSIIPFGMNLEELKTVSEVAGSWLSSLAILVGGGWVFWKFILQREAQPKIEIGLDLNVLGRVGDEWLIDVIAVVTNRGTVRHYLRDFWFDLNVLSPFDPIEIGDDEIDGQVRFRSPDRRRYWIAAERTGFFIDPSVTQRYTHVTTVPADVTFLLVYGRFRYPKDYHPVERAFALPGAPGLPESPSRHVDHVPPPVVDLV
jgi:hypothetical protein